MVLCLVCINISAFPPAPHHTLHGTVRDQFGEPLRLPEAKVVMESQSGVTITGPVVPNLAPGKNYTINVPMDSGITPDTYTPTALRPTLPFQMKVVIGRTIYLPIEMKGSFLNLGDPSAQTKLDLTLGVDSDGDGLPDAWEQALIAASGGGLGLEDINPNDDSDGDNISNLAEYLAGTYAFDPEDGFRVELKGFNADAPVLEFLALRGRSYSVQASTNLKDWTTLRFRIPSSADPHVYRSVYSSTDVRQIEVEVESQPEAANISYRLMVE